VADGRLIALDVMTILSSGRATGEPRSPGQRATDLRMYVSLVRRVIGGSPATARQIADRLLTRYPDVRLALLSVAMADAARGEVSVALASIRRLRSISDTRRLRRYEERLADRLQEMDSAWLPTITSQPRRVDHRGSDVVMHLLKGSLPDRQSGYTIRSREVLRAQQAAGLDPFVVTPYGFPADRPDVPAIETIDGVAHHRLSPGSPIADLPATEVLSRTAAAAADVVVRERPAIIHAASGHRGYDLALVGLALKAHLGVPLVYEVRGFLEASWTSDPSIADADVPAELTRLRMAAEDRVLAAADGITTLGQAMRDELVARGAPPDRIVVVPNGIDPVAFAPTVADPALRRRYGLEDRWVFGYISNLDHVREGQDLLIEVTGRLLAEGRDVACLIVGDGHRRPELEAMAHAAGLRDRVVFTGRVPHTVVRDHYALLDAFVIARTPDRAARFTTPLKPYEAMAMGLPLVVSDLPALVEIAAPGERGLAFPAEDAAALAATLGALMDQPDVGTRLATAGRAWVLNERTWAANGPRYRDLYADILARGARSR
jgi:glycosyltransferase involved in cell wall biosynthesis